MSNFAALIEDLSIAGSRLTDGTPNASGVVYFFQPGTNVQVNVYAGADASVVVTQPITLGEGGKLPSELSAGVFATQPVRILIQDASGNTVTDSTYIPATAGDVGVSNVATTATTLDAWITQAQTSTGGTNLQYKESGGATERPIQDKFREQGISVKDFGAKGDGINVDTTAINAALSRAKVLSCNVLFPAGTYKTDGALTLTSATGVQLIGAGHAATVIKPTHSTANGFTFTSCTGCGIHGMSILHTTGSTGAGFLASACLNFSVNDVAILANATYVGFDYGMDFSGNGTIDYLTNCYSLNANLVALRLGNSGTSQAQIISGNQIGASSAAPVSPTSGIEFTATGGTYYLTGNTIVGATNNVLFSAMPSAKFLGNANDVILGSTQFSGATATLFPQLGNGVYGYTEDVASAGTFTPNLLKGNHIRVRATSTGAAITIAAPTPAPSASQFGVWFFLDVFNNAGGALSNPYTIDAAYRLATVPNQTDLNHNQYLLVWDPTTSKWRQVSLSVTT